MMWLLKKIFGSSDVIDAGIKGIDKAIFTNEEKATHFIDLLRHYEPFKLAQRFLAFAFCGTYLIVVFIYLILISFDSPVAYQVLDGSHQFNLHYIVMIIVTFYFGGGVANGLKNTKK